MWITYSCDGGTDRTTKETPKQATPLPPTCPRQHGVMRSHDIPLNGGWINILCVAAGGDRRKRQAGNMMMPCIFIHKVRADCQKNGGPIQGQMNLVSWEMDQKDAKRGVMRVKGQSYEPSLNLYFCQVVIYRGCYIPL